MFNLRIHRLIAESKEALNDSNLPYFDCRLAHYGTREEAMSLILWRAHDCGVNGISDAVHHLPGTSKIIKAQGSREKLQYLCEKGLLPLPAHQACGTYFVRVKRVIQGFNPKTNQAVKSLRNIIESVPGHVLIIAKDGLLYPEDDPQTADAVAEEGDELADRSGDDHASQPT